MKYRSGLFAAVVIFAAVALDQAVKHLIIQKLAVSERIDLLPFLALYHTRNYGIAFSMLSSFSDTGLVLLTILIILFVFWLFRHTEPHKKLARFGYLLVIGGAIGNLIDRIRFHYVTDYMLFHTGKWSFAIFNLADIFITTGAFFIILNEILCWKKENNALKGK